MFKNPDKSVKYSPHIDMTAKTTHVVHSGKYFMKTNAIRAATKMRYACCKRRGPFQCIQIIPMTPKFHIARHKVI